tara:strand:+ start:7759 stop:8787 length:1029 start_codon:yes stop_codon:yes gene_type:complete
MAKYKKKYNQRGGADEINNDAKKPGFLNKIDNILYFRILTKIQYLFTNSYPEFIHYKIDLLINILLFVLIITFIIFQALLIMFDMHFVMGWLYACIFLVSFLFILKLFNNLYIFFKTIIRSNEDFKKPFVFSEDMVFTFKTIFENFGSSFPLIMLFSFLFSCIKLIPFKREYLYNSLIFIVFVIFVLLILFSAFLKFVFAFSSRAMSRILLYFFVYILYIYTLVYLISEFTDTMLDSILVKIKVINEEEYGLSNNEDNIKYELSKKMLDDYVILKDMPDFKDLGSFAYLISMIVIIIILIFDAALIYLANNPRVIVLINNLLSTIITKLYDNLRIKGSVKQI